MRPQRTIGISSTVACLPEAFRHGHICTRKYFGEHGLSYLPALIVS